MPSSSLTPWLKNLVSKQSNCRVEFKLSPSGYGLGGFALVDFQPGDVIFNIPSELILSSRSNCVANDPSIKAMLEKDPSITLESSLFVYLAKESQQGKHEYINTLPKLHDTLTANQLKGTNLGTQVQKDKTKYNRKKLDRTENDSIIDV